MIIGMRTRRTHAARVAELTTGTHLAGKPKSDDSAPLSRFVDVGADFEAHLDAVESASVLFELYAGDGHRYVASGELGEPVPTGWMMTGAQFEVGWPTDAQRSRLVRSHFGARRKAFNWGLAQVKSDLDAKKLNSEHESVQWTQGALRKAWNRAKGQVAPWWAENSKEAYSTGLADLETALNNWSASKTGSRQGRRVGFPRFNRLAVTRIGCGSPPARCAWRRIGAPSPCR